MYSYRQPKEPQRKQDLDYRFNLTRDLLTNLHRGECCSVVGVGSCGKSRLLLHLSRPETMEHHLGQNAYNHFIVLIQCNEWLNDTIWAAYEAMTRSLMDLINNAVHSGFRNAQRDLAGMYEAVVNERDLALTHVLTGLKYLLDGTGLRITFCFDEFDFVFEKFDAQLFRNLRALRNRHKYQLTYLAATRRQMPYQRAKEMWPDVEEFYELFTDNTFAIGPYDERDAINMIVDLETRYEYPLKKTTRSLLHQVTGGHPGLIGASYRLLEQLRRQPTSHQEMESVLVPDPTNYKECKRIWESLRPDEWGALKRLANGRIGRGDEALLAEIKAKGLIVETGTRAGIAIFSPIFHEFARRAEE